MFKNFVGLKCVLLVEPKTHGLAFLLKVSIEDEINYWAVEYLELLAGIC